MTLPRKSRKNFTNFVVFLDELFYEKEFGIRIWEIVTIATYKLDDSYRFTQVRFVNTARGHTKMNFSYFLEKSKSKSHIFNNFSGQNGQTRSGFVATSP